MKAKEVPQESFADFSNFRDQAAASPPTPTTVAAAATKPGEPPVAHKKIHKSKSVDKPPISDAAISEKTERPVPAPRPQSKRDSFAGCELRVARYRKVLLCAVPSLCKHERASIGRADVMLILTQSCILLVRLSKSSVCAKVFRFVCADARHANVVTPSLSFHRGCRKNGRSI